MLRVRDGQTVCLGGFISDDVTTDESKIPLLGDIPILGYLFKFTTHSYTKRELLIFISPHILETPYEVQRMTNQQRQKSTSKVKDERYNEDILKPQVDLRPAPMRDPLPEALRLDGPEGSSGAETSVPREPSS